MSDTYEKSATQEIVALDLKRINKGAIIASFTAWLPAADLRIYDCLWGRKSPGEEWVILPRRPWTDRDGATRYAKIIAFGSDRTERAFQRAALTAVRELDARTPR